MIMTLFDLFYPDNLPETIRIKVTPKAKSSHIKLDKSQDDTPLYRVYITAPAEKGKANKAAIALLAKEMGLPKSAFTIVLGSTSRTKLVKISR